MEDQIGAATVEMTNFNTFLGFSSQVCEVGVIPCLTKSRIGFVLFALCFERQLLNAFSDEVDIRSFIQS